MLEVVIFYLFFNTLNYSAKMKICGIFVYELVTVILSFKNLVLVSLTGKYLRLVFR